jgi:membrane-bound ClpP family serine protease
VWFGLLLFCMSPVPIVLATYVPSTGAEALVTADRDDIIVQVDGEPWRAKSDEPLAPQQPVEVLAPEGLTLTVSPHRAASLWTAVAGGEGGQGAGRPGGVL